MSPTKKKTAKKKSASSAAKKKSSAKGAAKQSAIKAKSTRKKAAAKKTAAAKKSPAAKKTASKSKKAAAKKTAAPKAKRPPRLATAATAPQNETTAPPPVEATKEAKRQLAAPKAPKKRAPRVKPIPLSRLPHPKFGFKFECFHCQAKFYDLNRPDPICPKCGSDQRDKPRVVPQLAPLKRPRKIDRPMAPLLDEDDETPRETDGFEEIPEVVPDPTAGEMFDDAVSASVADDDDLFEEEDGESNGGESPGDPGER